MVHMLVYRAACLSISGAGPFIFHTSNLLQISTSLLRAHLFQQIISSWQIHTSHILIPSPSRW